MFLKKIPVYLLILALFFSFNFQVSVMNNVYAQDDGGDSGGGDDSGDDGSDDGGDSGGDEGGDDGSGDQQTDDGNNDAPDDGSSGLSEGSHDDWASDPNFDDPGFTPADPNYSNPDLDALQDEGTLDDLGFKVDPNGEEGNPYEGMGHGVVDVSGGDLAQAREAESQAYQSLYSYEAEHGMDGSAEHQSLQHAAAAASAATQVAEGTFESHNSPAVNEVANAGNFQNELTNGLVEGANTGKTLDQVLDGISIPAGVSPDQIGVAVGAAMPVGTGYGEDFSDSKGKNPEQLASSVAADLIAGHGGGTGDIMGGAAIAAQTVMGANGTAAQITQTSIAAAAPEVENANSTEFASAAFATANTMAGNMDRNSSEYSSLMSGVYSQLDGLGVSPDNIVSGAVSQGVHIGQHIGAAPAAETTPADQAATGPAGGSPAGPVQPPAGAAPPAEASGPAPAPGRQVNPLPGVNENPLGGPPAQPAAPAPNPGAPTDNKVSISQPTEGSVAGKDEPTSNGFSDRVYSANFPITDNTTGQQVGNVAVNVRDVDNRFDPSGAKDEVTVTVNNWGGSNTTVSVPLDQVVTNGSIDVGKVDKVVEQNR